MNKPHKSHILTSIPRYDGAAVYALIDDVGKPYIGSTNNFRLRVKAWETQMRKVLNNGKVTGLMSHAIGYALLDGHTFSAKIIEELPLSMSRSQRVERERAALATYGGTSNTYNAVAVSHNYSKGED